MKPLWDEQCDKCQHVWEVRKNFNDPTSACPRCGSDFTHTLLSPGIPYLKAKDPYDLLDGRIPSKPIKSYANDKRKGGKDTT